MALSLSFKGDFVGVGSKIGSWVVLVGSVSIVFKLFKSNYSLVLYFFFGVILIGGKFCLWGPHILTFWFISVGWFSFPKNNPPPSNHGHDMRGLLLLI